MRVAHCLESERAGIGARLARLLAERGAPAIEHLSITLPGSASRLARFDLGGARFLARSLERAASSGSKIDLVHAHGFLPGWAACRVAGRRPVLLSLHERWTRSPWLAKRGYRRLIGRPEAVVASSWEIYRSFVFGGGRDARRIETLALGPELMGEWSAPLSRAAARAALLEKIECESSGGLLVVALGPLDRSGGEERLLEAWRTLPRELAAAARLVIWDEASVHGEIPPELLSAVDVAIFSSFQLEQPRSALAAMQAGCAIVATAPGSVAEVLERGAECLGPRWGDTVALGRAIAQVVGDSELRGRLGQAARARFERSFSARRTLAAHQALYRRLATGGARRAVGG